MDTMGNSIFFHDPTLQSNHLKCTQKIHLFQTVHESLQG